MPVVEIKIPSPGESITEVAIETWHKEDGEFVQIDEILCEIETDKATLPMPAEVAGTVQIILKEGADAKVGDVLCKIDTAGILSADSNGATTKLSNNAVSEKVEPSSVGYAAGHPSPAALKLMNEKSWDIDLLKELSSAMMDASICGLGQAAPNPMLSVIKHFPSEVTN